MNNVGTMEVVVNGGTDKEEGPKYRQNGETTSNVTQTQVVQNLSQSDLQLDGFLEPVKTDSYDFNKNLKIQDAELNTRTNSQGGCSGESAATENSISESDKELDILSEKFVLGGKRPRKFYQLVYSVTPDQHSVASDCSSDLDQGVETEEQLCTEVNSNDVHNKIINWRVNGEIDVDERNLVVEEINAIGNEIQSHFDSEMANNVIRSHSNSDNEQTHVENNTSGESVQELLSKLYNDLTTGAQSENSSDEFCNSYYDNDEVDPEDLHSGAKQHMRTLVKEEKPQFDSVMFNVESKDLLKEVTLKASPVLHRVAVQSTDSLHSSDSHNSSNEIRDCYISDDEFGEGIICSPIEETEQEHFNYDDINATDSVVEQFCLHCQRTDCRHVILWKLEKLSNANPQNRQESVEDVREDLTPEIQRYTGSTVRLKGSEYNRDSCETNPSELVEHSVDPESDYEDIIEELKHQGGARQYSSPPVNTCLDKEVYFSDKRETDERHSPFVTTLELNDRNHGITLQRSNTFTCSRMDRPVVNDSPFVKTVHQIENEPEQPHVTTIKESPFIKTVYQGPRKRSDSGCSSDVGSPINKSPISPFQRSWSLRDSRLKGQRCESDSDTTSPSVQYANKKNLDSLTQRYRNVGHGGYFASVSESSLASCEYSPSDSMESISVASPSYNRQNIPFTRRYEPSVKPAGSISQCMSMTGSTESIKKRFLSQMKSSVRNAQKQGVSAYERLFGKKPSDTSPVTEPTTMSAEDVKLREKKNGDTKSRPQFLNFSKNEISLEASKIKQRLSESSSGQGENDEKQEHKNEHQSRKSLLHKKESPSYNSSDYEDIIPIGRRSNCNRVKLPNKNVNNFSSETSDTDTDSTLISSVPGDNKKNIQTFDYWQMRKLSSLGVLKPKPRPSSLASSTGSSNDGQSSERQSAEGQSDASDSSGSVRKHRLRRSKDIITTSTAYEESHVSDYEGPVESRRTEVVTVEIDRYEIVTEVDGDVPDPDECIIVAKPLEVNNAMQTDGKEVLRAVATEEVNERNITALKNETADEDIANVNYYKQMYYQLIQILKERQPVTVTKKSNIDFDGTDQSALCRDTIQTTDNTGTERGDESHLLTLNLESEDVDLEDRDWLIEENKRLSTILEGMELGECPELESVMEEEGCRIEIVTDVDQMLRNYSKLHPERCKKDKKECINTRNEYLENYITENEMNSCFTKENNLKISSRHSDKENTIKLLEKKHDLTDTLHLMETELPVFDNEQREDEDDDFTSKENTASILDRNRESCKEKPAVKPKPKVSKRVIKKIVTTRALKEKPVPDENDGDGKSFQSIVSRFGVGKGSESETDTDVDAQCGNVENNVSLAQDELYSDTNGHVPVPFFVEKLNFPVIHDNRYSVLRGIICVPRCDKDFNVPHDEQDLDVPGGVGDPCDHQVVQNLSSFQETESLADSVDIPQHIEVLDVPMIHNEHCSETTGNVNVGVPHNAKDLVLVRESELLAGKIDAPHQVEILNIPVLQGECYSETTGSVLHSVKDLAPALETKTLNGQTSDERNVINSSKHTDVNIAENNCVRKEEKLCMSTLVSNSESCSDMTENSYSEVRETADPETTTYIADNVLDKREEQLPVKNVVSKKIVLCSRRTEMYSASKGSDNASSDGCDSNKTRQTYLETVIDDEVPLSHATIQDVIVHDHSILMPNPTQSKKLTKRDSNQLFGDMVQQTDSGRTVSSFKKSANFEDTIDLCQTNILVGDYHTEENNSPSSHLVSKSSITLQKIPQRKHEPIVKNCLSDKSYLPTSTVSNTSYVKADLEKTVAGVSYISSSSKCSTVVTGSAQPVSFSNVRKTGNCDELEDCLTNCENVCTAESNGHSYAFETLNSSCPSTVLLMGHGLTKRKDSANKQVTCISDNTISVQEANAMKLQHENNHAAKTSVKTKSNNPKQQLVRMDNDSVSAPMDSQSFQHDSTNMLERADRSNDEMITVSTHLFTPEQIVGMQCCEGVISTECADGVSASCNPHTCNDELNNDSNPAINTVSSVEPPSQVGHSVTTTSCSFHFTNDEIPVDLNPAVVLASSVEMQTQIGDTDVRKIGDTDFRTTSCNYHSTNQVSNLAMDSLPDINGQVQAYNTDASSARYNLHSNHEAIPEDSYPAMDSSDALVDNAYVRPASCSLHSAYEELHESSNTVMDTLPNAEGNAQVDNDLSTFIFHIIGNFSDSGSSRESGGSDSSEVSIDMVESCLQTIDNSKLAKIKQLLKYGEDDESSDVCMNALKSEAVKALQQADELQAIINEIKGEVELLQKENEGLKPREASRRLVKTRGEASSQSLVRGERVVEVCLNLGRVVNKTADQPTAGPQKNGNVFLGSVNLSQKPRWQELYWQVQKLFLEHLDSIDPECTLGLTEESLESIQYGATSWSTGTEFPNEFCDFGDTSCPSCKTCYFRLKGASSSSCDNLVYQTLLPKDFVEDCVSMLLEHRYVIICGPAGTGKSFLAWKLAEYLVERKGEDVSMNSVVTLSVSQATCQDVKEFLVKTVDGEEGSRPEEDQPSVVVLDQLNRVSSLKDVLNVQILETSFQSTRPYIIGTMTYSSPASASLSFEDSHHVIRWIWLSVKKEPVSGLLGRCLRWKLQQTRAIFTGDQVKQLTQLFDWLTQVWQHINKTLERFCSSEVTLGPCLFLSCPLSVQVAETWFINVWNYSIIPYLQQAVRIADKMYGHKGSWEDPTNWVIEHYYWDVSGRKRNTPRLMKLRQEDLFERLRGSPNRSSSNTPKSSVGFTPAQKKSQMADFLNRVEELVNDDSSDSDSGTSDSRTIENSSGLLETSI